ncbi:hypothetical protein V3C99_001497 [Haemonchus contortus]
MHCLGLGLVANAKWTSSPSLYFGTTKYWRVSVAQTGRYCRGLPSSCYLPLSLHIHQSSTSRNQLITL